VRSRALGRMTAYPFPSIDPRAQAKVAFGALLAVVVACNE
jgi:hypothetical protein